jgi:hypothetical protein
MVRLVKVRGEVTSRRVGLEESEEIERGVGEDKVSGIGGKVRGEVDKISEVRIIKDIEGKSFGAISESASSDLKG